MTATATANPNNSALTDAGLIVRSATIEPVGFDEKTRSISCVLATETPVRMYDWNNGGYIDEVLRADGGDMPSQLPLLDNHSRYSALSVVGSARNIKTANGQINGRVYIAEKVGRADEIYELVRQGHLTDVSVGYRYGVGDYIDIQRGQSAKIGSKTYTASGERTLRVVTRWEAKELSVTPIGADHLAKMRSLSDCKFGHANVTDEISSSLNREPIHNDRQDLKMSATATATETKPADNPTTVVGATRSDAKPDETKTTSTADAASVRAEIEKEVTERIDYARSFSSQGVRQELIDEAIKERWDRNKMNERFLQSITTERKDAVPTKPPAGHVSDNTIGREEIQSLFLMRANVAIEGGHMASDCHAATFARHAHHEQDMSWAVRAAQTLGRGAGNLEPKAEKAMNFANQHRNIHLVQACAMALDFAGIKYDRWDDREIVTRAVTTQSVAAFLTNALGASILDGFVGCPDTTSWCKEVQLPNDNPQPVAKGGMMSRLQKRLSGQVPVPATREATEEFISVATFSEQYFVDRKDLLADRFGKINDAPSDIGIAAREVIMDLVYATLLSNPTMADTNALFSTAHGNQALNAALGPETLAARKTAMANQTNNGRIIGARPGILLVPESKSHYAEELMGSSEKRDTTATTVYGTKNWAQGKYEIISEPRLDVGCVNPDSGVFVVGKPLDYYLVEIMRRWGILKAFLRSNGGGPIVEQWMPGDGRIGVGTTVELECGTKAVAWEGLQRGTGAGS